MQNVSQIGILGGTGPGTGCYFAYSLLFEAIRRYSRTRMSGRFLIQGISYNRMRTRSGLGYPGIILLEFRCTVNLGCVINYWCRLSRYYTAGN